MLCAILFGQMSSKITIILLLTISNLAWGQGNGLYKFIGKNGKYGFIDKEGNVKVKPEYLNVSDFSDGLCFVSEKVVKRGYKWICIDTLGRKVFEIDDFPETEFNEGFSRISSFSEHWFIDKSGQKVFDKVWKDGQANFKNGVAYVSDIQFSNFYPIDTKGNRVDTNTYKRHEVYLKQNDTTTIKATEKLVRFKQDSLWGFKDLNGNVVIEPKYQLVDKFENGLCGVRLKYQRFEVANDYYLDSIINEKGEIVSQQPMHCYQGFQGELIEYYGGFHFSGGVHYLDRQGQKVIPKE